jgi:hypothetical protein
MDIGNAGKNKQRCQSDHALSDKYNNGGDETQERYNCSSCFS